MKDSTVLRKKTVNQLRHKDRPQWKTSFLVNTPHHTPQAITTYSCAYIDIYRYIYTGIRVTLSYDIKADTHIGRKIDRCMCPGRFLMSRRENPHKEKKKLHARASTRLRWDGEINREIEKLKHT